MGDVVTFAPDDARKIVDVLRKRPGDDVEIIDSAAQTFASSLRIDGKAVAAHLDSLLPGTPESVRTITLAQGMPKGQKFDFVVEKATELGVHRIVPLTTSRSIGGGSVNKLERWRKLARAAAQQCGRNRVPHVDPPIEFERFVPQIGDFDGTLFAWELATTPLHDALRDPGLREARNVLAVVGPEGGFAHAEAEAAIEAGAQAVSLGSRILRTETAPLVILTALLYESGEL